MLGKGPEQPSRDAPRASLALISERPRAGCTQGGVWEECSGGVSEGPRAVAAASGATLHGPLTLLPQVPTKCEPGCVCAKGLYENASGQCVPPEECPCEFAGISYPRGAELHTDCKSW